MDKQVLLIAGGGTIGSYVSRTLLEMGCRVDVICLEERTSTSKGLTYYCASATLSYLSSFLSNRHYDAIVNFLHYESATLYASYHALLAEHTDQLVFLSSYRVYADLEHPVTEEAPQLCDVLSDEGFFRAETYAMGKMRCEQYIKNQSKTDNWTIVRPVISFAGKRFDVVMYNNILEAGKSGKPVLMPQGARNLVAGLDWAGNVGRIIAHLLFKPECLGQSYTVSSGQNLTWGTIADYYTELAGIRFDWIPTEEYIKTESPDSLYRLLYDRLYNRDMDVSRVLRATGLKKEDFTPIKDAIIMEMECVAKGVL